MIAQLFGRITAKDDSSFIIMVGGVGYRVLVPKVALDSIVLGDELHIYTHMAVYDDRFELFGFLKESELNFFKQLIKVRDVGPKSALAILSAGNTADIQQAIVDEHTAMLMTIPGVGKKTAERIILELKEKIYIDSSTGKGVKREGADLIVSALINLGYSQKEAQEAIAHMPRDLASDDERLRWVLKNIGTN